MQNWGLTDPGCVRKQNQDAYLIEQLDRNSLLCVVCDGMGGAKSGNIAPGRSGADAVQEEKHNTDQNDHDGDDVFHERLFL